MSAALKDADEVNPQPAIAALLTFKGPVLLDLDETLYLRNSTEDFIDSARPGVLALLAMRLLDAVRPWRWTGGDSTRDVWRIRCVLTLFPWTTRYWATRVRALAAEAGNEPLIAAVKQRTTVPSLLAPIITTLGFRPIVAPLVAALGLPPQIRIVAASVTTFADRRDGKLRLAVKALGHETIRKALVLTDSRQDEELLQACAMPVRTVWPDARFRPALSGLYLPGQYLSQVKRPGERYVTRGILQEDFALWILCSIGLATSPVTHFLGLGLLLLSFWTIYEGGYADNDRVGARFEPAPKLNRAFHEARVVTPLWTPWAWAIASGAGGVFLLRGTGPDALAGGLAWLAVLLSTHGFFLLYNRFDKTTRIWGYAGLQLARSAAFVALVPISAIGAIALGAHILAKWMPYYIYRMEGRNWPDAPHFLNRLLFFLVLAVLLAFATGFRSLATGTTLALLAWNVFRARHELFSMLLGAHRIDRDKPGP